MFRARSARYQFVIGAIILIVGLFAALVAIKLWERFLVDQALEERQILVRSLAIGTNAILSHHESGDDLTLSNVLEQVREEAEIGAVRLMILSPDGTIVIHSGPPGLPGEPSAPPLWSHRPLEPGIRLLNEEKGAGAGILVTENLMQGGEQAGSLVVEFDMSPLRRGMARAVTIIVTLVAGGAVITLLFVGFLVRRWVNPIEQLSHTMNQVQVGNLDVELDESRTDEIGVLGRHFNEMLRSIRAARGQSLELVRKQANIEKFAALGRLSAGVAHEINNPVGGILTCIETMRGLEPGSERFDEYLTLVRSGLERIGKIVRQLLTFARQRGGERRDLDLNAILKEVMVLSLFHNQDEEVEVVLRFGDLPIIRAAPDLLNQIFLNLVLNALQEMPQGGTLTVSTRAENAQVHVSFRDTGRGIPEENLERIFEPFFTTKEVGVGTGLGLSVALGIIEAHGGTITAANREEGGAIFTVTLPIDSPVPVPEDAAEAMR